MNARLLLFNLSVVVSSIAIDQAIKAAVVAQMELGEMIPLVPFLALLHARNTGIAFSWLDGFGPGALIALGCLVLVIVMALWVRTPASRPVTHLGLGLIVGGAVGNLIDRGMFGYVVDYFYFHTPLFDFAIFNFADACISVGAGLVLLDEFILAARSDRAAAGRSAHGDARED